MMNYNKNLSRLSIIRISKRATLFSLLLAIRGSQIVNSIKKSRSKSKKGAK